MYTPTQECLHLNKYLVKNFYLIFPPNTNIYYFEREPCRPMFVEGFKLGIYTHVI